MDPRPQLESSVSFRLSLIKDPFKITEEKKRIRQLFLAFFSG